MSLRTRLEKTGSPIHAPGAFDALSALLIQQAGFEAVYLSGASIAYTQLGRPDLGLVSFDQVADVVARICERVEIPLVVDADTGFGNALNVARTVKVFERNGAQAIQLEDQTFPKRCGHLSGKGVTALDEMVGKVHAALDARRSDETLIIARTDAIAVEGFDAALERAVAYAEAGADVVFVEAPRDLDEMKRIIAALGQTPAMANMVEGGKTPILSRDALGELGFKLVISPGGLVRALIPAAETFLKALRAEGSTVSYRDRMTDLAGVNDRIGLEDMLKLGDRYEPERQEAAE